MTRASPEATHPAQSLASAGNWDRIGSALDAIFAHLPKVRQSRYYDLDRLARLVEASTLHIVSPLLIESSHMLYQYQIFDLKGDTLRRGTQHYGVQFVREFDS